MEISTAVLEWAATRVGAGAEFVAATPLRTVGGPWLLQFHIDGLDAEAILKYGRSAEWRELYACEAAALRLAAEHALPAPRLLGFQPSIAALLLSRLPGSTQIPADPSRERLRALGRTAAAIHAVHLTPSDELPLRVRHTSWTDFALWRRWGNRYRAASEADRDAILRRFITEHPRGGAAAMTGVGPWSVEVAQETFASTSSTPLLDAAGDRLLEARIPAEPTVFVHGDLWQGNTLWQDDRCVGVIDWEVGGAGHPGVDLGCLRWDAAMLHGPWAADEVLAGWEQASGRGASAVAYWDLVAVLNYPTDMGRLLSTLGEQGRPDLDAPTLTERRDAYVVAALDALDRS